MASRHLLRVGWIGIGLMGLPMCSNILLHHQQHHHPQLQEAILDQAPLTLTVYSRTPSKARPLIDLGATLVDSPLAVAQQSDVVFTMLTAASDVREVVLGPSGVLSMLKPGSFIIDCISNEPGLAREIYYTVLSKGIYQEALQYWRAQGMYEEILTAP